MIPCAAPFPAAVSRFTVFTIFTSSIVFHNQFLHLIKIIFFAIIFELLCFDALSISEASWGGVPGERKNRG